MTERGILFSAPMVRALLDGSKTQTRRVVKGIALSWLEADLAPDFVALPENHACPYGQPGNRLWVRETWAQPAALDPGPTVYRADYPGCVPAGYTNVPPADAITWKPSIHMPRAASRILLEIVSVRVERLQDISEADAAVEGWKRRPEVFDDPQVHTDAARDWYMDLWEQINGAGSWAANPWVWVVEFKRVTP